MAEREPLEQPPKHLLQCPICGELLHAEGEDRYAYCHYCEAGLKLARGASGRPLAANVATRIAAAEAEVRQAYEQVWSELSSLLRERHELWTQMEEEESVHDTTWDSRLAGIGIVLALLLAVAAVLLDNDSLILAAVAAYIGGRGAFYVVRGIAESRKQTVARRHWPRIKEVTNRIREAEARMEELEEQLTLGVGDPGEDD